MPEIHNVDLPDPRDAGVPLHMDIPPEKMVCPQCGQKAGPIFKPTDKKAPWGEPIWHCSHCKIDMLVPPKPYCKFLKRLITKFDCLNCPQCPARPILEPDSLIKESTGVCYHFVDNGVSEFLKLAKKAGFKKW